MAPRLLLIDEDIRLVALVGDYLSKLGYEVHRASESDEAVALLKNYKYSVVIAGTDWKEFGNTVHNLTQYLKNLADRPRIILWEKPPASPGATPEPGDNAVWVVEKPVSLLRLGELMSQLSIDDAE